MQNLARHFKKNVTLDNQIIILTEDELDIDSLFKEYLQSMKSQ